MSFQIAEVPSWPGFYVTDHGLILSGYGRGWKRGQPLRDPPIERALNYNHVGEPYITFHANGRRETFKVCRLVAEAFIGPRPFGLQCSHLNGNPADNRVANLVWETAKENTARKRQHGTWNSGERNGQCNITEQQIKAILDIKRFGVPNRLIAFATKISETHICNIAAGKVRKEG